MSDEETQTAEMPSGFPEGTVIGDEKIVHDYDEEHNLIGWHKEVVANG